MIALRRVHYYYYYYYYYSAEYTVGNATDIFQRISTSINDILDVDTVTR
jgi:hypothetical protein